MVEKPSIDFASATRRKRSSLFSTQNPHFGPPVVCKDQISQHRTCWKHLMAYEHKNGMVTRKQAEEIKYEYNTAGCFFDSIHHGKRSKGGKRADPTQFKATKMSSNSFGYHLESIWMSVAEEKRKCFAYLDCFWFGMYREASQRTKVLSWIKKKKIFSGNYKYVFVPICVWSHWNLLILCHLGESEDSESTKPCMLLLDSLHMAGPERFEMEIRKFVMDIFKEEGISDDRVSEIPFVIPKVPQQTNQECGSFVLYFIKKFMEMDPDEVFSEGYEDILKQDWFPRKDIDEFCQKLEKESKERSHVEEMSSTESVVHETCIGGDKIFIID